MKHVVRVIAHLALLAHIYISMAGFTLALLFGATGLTLNHEDFGFSDPQIARSEILVDKNFVDNPDQATLEQCVQQKLGIRSRSTAYHDDPDQNQMPSAFRAARPVVTINRLDARGQVEKAGRGLLGTLGAFHKAFVVVT